MQRPMGSQPPVKRCATPGFAVYAVRFSPFFPNTCAAAGAANFGLVGNGRLSVIDAGGPLDATLPPGGAGVTQAQARGPFIAKAFDTQDGLYDVAWSELNENQLVTASGDGSVKLWDLTLNDFPVRKWHEHSKEVFCVDWSNAQKDLFCTSSWDGQIKIWTPERPHSLLTIPSAHGGACVYAARFAPSHPHTIASCAADGRLRIWDTRAPPQVAPGGSSLPAIEIDAHNGAEALALDWNKYDGSVLATASVDRSVRAHDLRLAQGEAAPSSAGRNATTARMLGHEYAVRRVSWSPHARDMLATASYDMTARIWGVSSSAAGPAPHAAMGQGAQLLRIHDAHTEFVVGLDWSLFEQGAIATGAWDQQVHFWRA